jgi:hypothetical protein
MNDLKNLYFIKINVGMVVFASDANNAYDIALHNMDENIIDSNTLKIKSFDDLPSEYVDVHPYCEGFITNGRERQITLGTCGLLLKQIINSNNKEDCLKTDVVMW